MQVATRKNPLKVDSVHLSVIAHITPGELLNSLTETDRVNGFANRFLLSCARRSKLLPDGGADTDTSSIVKGLVQARQAALKIRRVRRDAQASALWHSVYEHLTEERQGLFGAITSRAAAQVARLSLLYALLDRATEIRVEHLKAALAVWDYCERSAAYLFGSATGDPDANKILDALKGGQKTMKELHRLFGNNRDGGWLRAKLGQLAAMGKVEMDRIGTDGRTGEAWKLR